MLTNGLGVLFNPRHAYIKKHTAIILPHSHMLIEQLVVQCTRVLIS